MTAFSGEDYLHLNVWEDSPAASNGPSKSVETASVGRSSFDGTSMNELLVGSSPVAMTLMCSECPPLAPQPANWYCVECDENYCDDQQCWRVPKPHQKNKHTKRPIGEAATEDLSTIEPPNETPEHTPNDNDEKLRKQHSKDLNTLWLAVSESYRTPDGPLTFDERPRFEQIMEDHREWASKLEISTFYPRLVSFLGTTDAGKSSLIKELIHHVWDSKVTEEDNLEAPIPGGKTGLPTSSDIHLYLDRIEARRSPEIPLLFADCEGFGAGDYSFAAKVLEESMDMLALEAPEELSANDFERHHWTTTKWIETWRFAKRSLSWVNSSNEGRSDVIKKLFPKIAYNVSDVIIYVVANFKTVGAVLREVVEWSEQARISSINKATLPSLIILLNKSDSSEYKSEADWSPEKLTASILKENESLMRKSAIFRKRKDEMKELDLPHGKMKDILEFSYSSVCFFRVPDTKDKSRMQSQMRALHEKIRALTTKAHATKEKCRLLLPSAEANQIHRLTFDHFARSPDEPFNFVNAFFAPSMCPPGFSGNLFKLLHATLQVDPKKISSWHDKDFIRERFEALIPFICSTITMGYHRCGYNGKMGDFFEAEISEKLPSVKDGSYKKAVHQTVDRFINSVVPCGFIFMEPGSKVKRFCVNSRSAHGDNDTRGTHQDSRGLPLGFSPFDDSITKRFESLWGDCIESELAKIDLKLSGSVLELSGGVLLDNHRQAMRHLHDVKIAGLSLERLPGCAWCMIEPPSERLPCGHWICSSCVCALGTQSKDDDRVYVMSVCDQHPGEGKSLEPPFEMLQLPDTIGRRLLSLDEGGARGILQLRLLKAIQDKLGEDIALAQCFDLIGGTGVGGIAALGLGMCEWSVSEAFNKFTIHVPKAFVPCKSGWDRFWSWFGWPTYEHNNFVDSVQAAFDGHLQRFMAISSSQLREHGSQPTRVLVTAHKVGGPWVVFENWHSQQYFIGEVAKATACFETFFGRVKLHDGTEYTSAACAFPCPAKETLDRGRINLLKDSTAEPDVLVSVGCGHTDNATSGHAQNCANGNAVWKEHFGERSTQEPKRYIRLCPEYGNLSLLPSSESVENLKGMLGHILEPQKVGPGRKPTKNPLLSRVDEVFSQLVSTIFYFTLTSVEACRDGTVKVSGYIRCRYKDMSNITKAFGHRISSFKNPRFILGIDNDEWEMDSDTIREMETNGRFWLPRAGGTGSFRARSKDETCIRFMADEFSSESFISGCSGKKEAADITGR